jgi:hypothetical protein
MSETLRVDKLSAGVNNPRVVGGLIAAVSGERARQRAAATLFVSGVILPVAAAARLWGIRFCLPHPQCRPDEDAISAIAGAFRGGDLNPHVFNYPALLMLSSWQSWSTLPTWPATISAPWPGAPGQGDTLRINRTRPPITTSPSGAPAC